MELRRKYQIMLDVYLLKETRRKVLDKITVEDVRDNIWMLDTVQTWYAIWDGEYRSLIEEISQDGNKKTKAK